MIYVLSRSFPFSSGLPGILGVFAPLGFDKVLEVVGGRLGAASLSLGYALLSPRAPLRFP